jgi:hypothetical protein
VADDIVLDLDESGHLIGSELLNASARLDVDELRTATREIIVGIKEGAAGVLLFSLVASGQIELRRIDGWRKIPTVLSQHTAVAA